MCLQNQLEDKNMHTSNLLAWLTAQGATFKTLSQPSRSPHVHLSIAKLVLSELLRLGEGVSLELRKTSVLLYKGSLTVAVSLHQQC